ncbi:hypothetical protein EFZ10_10540 [Tatumella sp. TA1]|nr:hypothetical protein EFZ10_10540 [Tatumella sp. TA1]
MRNSVHGPLLRSGLNSSFKALGETGYPVFKMAFQLREAISRLDQGRDLARHLAVPQNDQGGDKTDWYSSFPGEVIPWKNATEAERSAARLQFNEFKMAVQGLSDQQLTFSPSEKGGDRRIFAKLLKSVIYFPDDEFLFLVNGVLVITFWGFVHRHGEMKEPLHWLSAPAPSPVAPKLASVEPIVPIQEPVTRPIILETVVKRPFRWWRWLLGFFVGLLLITLLLGLLRGCAPTISAHVPFLSTPLSHLPAIPGFSTQTPQSDDNLSLPSAHLPTIGSVSTDDHSSPAVVAPSSAAVTSDPPANASADDNLGQPPSATTPPSAVDSHTQPPALPQVNRQDTGNQTQPPIVPAAGKPLSLPSHLPDGQATFLNGQWRANGGIQDKFNGRPLQLQYHFAEGKGQVSVRQSNGVECHGPANGAVVKGQLNIDNPEQMTCSDGTHFLVPNISCSSATAGKTDCLGSNDGEKNFPIRMLQPNS